MHRKKMFLLLEKKCLHKYYRFWSYDDKLFANHRFFILSLEKQYNLPLQYKQLIFFVFTLLTKVFRGVKSQERERDRENWEWMCMKINDIHIP